VLTRGSVCVPPTVLYLPYRVFGSTLTAVRRSQLLARWPGTHSRILSGIQRAVQTVLCVYLKRTCSRVTSAFSALGVLNDYALYTNPRTHSLTPTRVVPDKGPLNRCVCVPCSLCYVLPFISAVSVCRKMARKMVYTVPKTACIGQQWMQSNLISRRAHSPKLDQSDHRQSRTDELMRRKR